MALSPSFIPVMWLGFRAPWKVSRHPWGSWAEAPNYPLPGFATLPPLHLVAPGPTQLLEAPGPQARAISGPCHLPQGMCPLPSCFSAPTVLAPSLPLLLRVPSAGSREDAPDLGPVGHREECL